MDTASITRPLQTEVQKTWAWITGKQTLIQTLGIFITVITLLIAGEIRQGPAAVVQSVLRAMYVLLAKLWTLKIGVTVVRAIWRRTGFFPNTPFEKKVSFHYLTHSCAHWTQDRVLAGAYVLCLRDPLLSQYLFPPRCTNDSTESKPAID